MFICCMWFLTAGFWLNVCTRVWYIRVISCVCNAVKFQYHSILQCKWQFIFMCVGCLGKRWPGFERLLIKRLEQNMFYQGLPLVCVCVCVWQLQNCALWSHLQGSKYHAAGLFNLEDWTATLSWNVGNRFPNVTASYPTWTDTSSTLLCWPKKLFIITFKCAVSIYTSNSMKCKLHF